MSLPRESAAARLGPISTKDPGRDFFFGLEGSNVCLLQRKWQAECTIAVQIRHHFAKDILVGGRRFMAASSGSSGKSRLGNHLVYSPFIRVPPHSPSHSSSVVGIFFATVFITFSKSCSCDRKAISQGQPRREPSCGGNRVCAFLLHLARDPIQLNEVRT